jgi:hypothetical protein
MPEPPPMNPDVNDIADRAKYGYAVGIFLLAAERAMEQAKRLDDHAEPENL